MLQVGLVLMVEREPLVEVLWRRRRVALRKCSSGRLPRRRLLVVVGVEQVEGSPGQKPPLLPPLRHPPPHRPHPAVPTQPVQHPPDAPLVPTQNGRQVRDAGEGHQPRYTEQTYLFVAHHYTQRHIGTSPAYAAKP